MSRTGSANEPEAATEDPTTPPNGPHFENVTRSTHAPEAVRTGPHALAPVRAHPPGRRERHLRGHPLPTPLPSTRDSTPEAVATRGRLTHG
ncbi:hypothetical protein STENM327S_01565 [Streptomyces tendae]